MPIPQDRSSKPKAELSGYDRNLRARLHFIEPDFGFMKDYRTTDLPEELRKIAQTDVDTKIRAHALYALSLLPKVANDVFATAANPDNHIAVRRAAAASLRNLTMAHSMGIGQRALRDGDHTVRQIASRSIRPTSVRMVQQLVCWLLTSKAGGVFARIYETAYRDKKD